MKNLSLAPMLALLGVFAFSACAGGEDDPSNSTPPASSCDGLRACCAEMEDAAEQTCLDLVDAQQAQASANVEQWCQATLDSYQQAGVCGGGAGGSSGSGGTGGTGGATGGSGGATGGSGGATGGSGGTGGASTCVHDECTTGDALDPLCSDCAAKVCADDPFCCQNSWNGFCVEGAQQLCGMCGGTGGTGGGGTCAHDECTTGDALDPSCSSCAATVCADDPYCCNNSWNSFCVEGAQQLCGLCGGTGGTGGGSGSCSHDECTTGDALDPSCSTCVATVCADDPYCCNTAWNSFCVDGAKNLCSMCL